MPRQVEGRRPPPRIPTAVPRLSLIVTCLSLLACYGGGWAPPAPPDPAPSGDDDDSAVGDDDDDSVITPLAIGLACVPAQVAVDVPYQQPVVVPITAEASWDDGSSSIVSADLHWSTLGDFGGSVDAAGDYTTPGTLGGLARIEVSWAGLLGSCSIEVHLLIDEDGTGDPAIADAVEGASTTNDDSCAPVLLYPNAGAILPRNQAPPHIQWSPGAGADTYVLLLENPNFSLQLTTHEAQWTPSQAQWAAITSSAGPDPITLTVRGGLWDPTTAGFAGALCAAATTPAITVSAASLQGTVFYWSTGTQGIMAVDMGQSEASAFLTAAETGVCVGCHTVNLANPERMAMNFGGGNGWAVVGDVSDPSNPVLAPEVRNGNFMALNPDGSRLVRSYLGVLYLDDLDINANIGVLPTTAHATHPNWSADGTKIAYSSCSAPISEMDWQVEGCHLRIIDALPGDQFGGDYELLAPDPAWNYYYPSISPDGQWIAFNRSTGESYDDADATLMLMPITGGLPIELSQANESGDLYNSWPRWGPLEGDEAWLAFASRRAYGDVTSGVAQVWMVGMNLDLALAGLDPSYPAVWLPGQDPTLGNHTPVWVPRYTAKP